MSLPKDLPELVKAGVITSETAERIEGFYESKNQSSSNRLLIVFGVLGALLIGLGIILILAHNWDDLSRGIKTAFAFSPLVIGQILYVYTLVKRKQNVAWRESSSAFLFMAVGASISLVSQIYHIPGDLSSFMLSWMLLCLPLIYVMNSSIASLLFITGTTYFAIISGYWFNSTGNPAWYWLLLLAALPHYYLLYRENPRSNFMTFHNWLVPISLLISLGIVGSRTEELMIVAYMSIFGLFYSIGKLDFFDRQKTSRNGYKILGSLGTISLLMSLSFADFWDELRLENLLFNQILGAPEFYAAVIITLLGAGVLYTRSRKKPFESLKPLSLSFILFVPIFIVGFKSLISAAILINVYVFAIAIFTIKDGASQNHLGILNFGLLIIAALVTCRFFDTDLSFVVRGVLFLSVGAGFFIANYRMLNKRKTNE